MVKTIAEERKKRSTAGTRMSSLVGKAVEDDTAFWSHSTWAEAKGDDISDDGSFHESDEESDAKVDNFDSDFDDSEGEEEDASGEEELLKEERRAKRAEGKKKMIDVVTAGRELMQKKKNAAQRKKLVRGNDLNSGLVLNVPGASPIIQNKGAIKVALVPASAPLPAPVSIPPKPAGNTAVFPGTIRKSSRAKISKFSVAEVVGKRSLRTSTLNNSIAASTTTSSSTRQQQQQPQQSGKARYKRKYTQEELLLEAVSETEAENQRWILNRKRLQMEENSKAALHKKMGHNGGNKKVISKFNSRRGCLNTFTFPEMDHVPEVFTRSKTSEQHRIQIMEQMQKDNTCVITGKKARYRDPKTNFGYHDLSAYKELRRRLDAGERLEQKETSSKEEKSLVSSQSSVVSAIPSQQGIPLSQPQKPSSIGIGMEIDNVALPPITLKSADVILDQSNIPAPAAPQSPSNSVGQEMNGKPKVIQQKDEKLQNGKHLESEKIKPPIEKVPNGKQTTKAQIESKTLPGSFTMEKPQNTQTATVENATPLDKPSKQILSTGVQIVERVSGTSRKKAFEENENNKEASKNEPRKRRKLSDSKSADGPSSSKSKVEPGSKAKIANTTDDATYATSNLSLTPGDMSKQPPEILQNIDITASLLSQSISPLETIDKVGIPSEIPDNSATEGIGQSSLSSLQASSNEQTHSDMQVEEMRSIGDSSQSPTNGAVQNIGQPSMSSLQSFNNEQLMMNMQLNALNQMNGMGLQYPAYNPMPMNTNVGLMNNAAMMATGNSNNNGMFQYSPGNQIAQYQHMLSQPSMDVASMLAMSIGTQGGVPVQPPSQHQQQEQLMQQNRELQMINQLYAANPEYSSNIQQPSGPQRNNSKKQNGQWPNGS